MSALKKGGREGSNYLVISVFITTCTISLCRCFSPEGKDLSQNQSARTAIETKNIDARQYLGASLCRLKPTDDDEIYFAQCMKWREMLQGELHAQCLGHSLL